MYIAKDKDDDSIWLYSKKPRLNKRGGFFEAECNPSLRLSDYEDNDIKALFGIDNLTFENSPIELEVKVKQK